MFYSLPFSSVTLGVIKTKLLSIVFIMFLFFAFIRCEIKPDIFTSAVVREVYTF